MWSSTYHVIHEAYRTIIPYPEDRTPICLHHVPHLFLPFVPFFLMAYLSRRPDTFYLRLLLLPLVICLTFGTYFRFMFTEPEFNIYNFGQGLLAQVLCGKAIDFAWRRDGMLKVGETKPGILSKSVTGLRYSPNDNGDGSSVGQNKNPPYVIPPIYTLLPPWLYDSLEVACTLRGLGWQFGTDLYVPRDSRPSERSAFLRATAISTFKHFLVFDAMISLVRLVPEVGSPRGGTIFRPELPILHQYALSTAIHIATGTSFIAGFEMCHGCATLFAVQALSSSPEMWPPLMDNPWISDSLHTFWARRWQQLLRQMFFVYGGFPGWWLAGDIGMLFGTFFASGMFHECGAYALGRGFSWFVVLFFTLQAPLLLLEKQWRRISGKKVGGTYGMLWVYFWVLVTAQPLVDSWHSRGLAGGLIIPPMVSPARQVFIPLLRLVEAATGFGPLSAVETFLGA